MKTPNNKIFTELPPLIETHIKKIRKQKDNLEEKNSGNKLINSKRNPAKSAIVSKSKFKKPAED